MHPNIPSRQDSCKQFRLVQRASDIQYFFVPCPLPCKAMYGRPFFTMVTGGGSDWIPDLSFSAPPDINRMADMHVLFTNPFPLHGKSTIYTHGISKDGKQFSQYVIIIIRGKSQELDELSDLCTRLATSSIG